MEREVNRDIQPRKIFEKSDKIVSGSDGWLSPSGAFYAAVSDEHKELADWIVENNLSEVYQDRFYREHVKSDLNYMNRSRKNYAASTHFLRDEGWILINGPVFRTDNALNYTRRQLEQLAESGIPVVGVYDGSKEFSSQETLEWVDNVVERVSDCVDKYYKEKQYLSDYPWTKDASSYSYTIPRNEAEHWEDMSSRGYTTLEDFKRKPFKTQFGDLGLVGFEKIKDILSQGFEDEIVFCHEMETYTFRLIRLESGERICVEYKFHHHDRDSGNDEFLNAYVVDNFTFRDKINKYLDSAFNAKVQGEYFQKIMKDRTEK